MAIRKCTLSALVWLLSVSPWVQASPSDIANQGLGENIAPCSSCHGAHGEGNAAAGFPRLAGLGAPYLEAQLDAFASGARENAVMQPIASALSTDQRSAMATYYSQLSAEGAQASKGQSDNPPDTGAELSEHGRWANDIPACVQCHGPAGVGVGEHFPALAGQPAAYLEGQLRAWRNGKRPGGPMGLMASIAAKLDESDIKPVAQYFAAQSPAPAKGLDHE